MHAHQQSDTPNTLSRLLLCLVALANRHTNGIEACFDTGHHLTVQCATIKAGSTTAVCITCWSQEHAALQASQSADCNPSPPTTSAQQYEKKPSNLESWPLLQNLLLRRLYIRFIGSNSWGTTTAASKPCISEASDHLTTILLSAAILLIGTS
eukprot:GHUV01015235.1.p1 GENE.GHUV01015235.1~~GHUV01015235.1.p1  ORF type:complete len:153 (-),score=18.56 GHUV01015235.1:2746-3204(-)